MIILLNYWEKKELPNWKLQIISLLSNSGVKYVIKYITAPKPRIPLSYKLEHKLIGSGEIVPNIIHATNNESVEDDRILNLSSMSGLQVLNNNKDCTILEFQYNGNNVASLLSIGELEIVKSLPSIKLSLVEISQADSISEVEIHILRTFSALRNLLNAQNECVNLLKYYLYSYNNGNNRSGSNFIKLNWSIKLLYHLEFYKQLSVKVINIVKSRLIKSHNEHWTVGLGKSPFLHSDLRDITLIEIPQNEFWADPFLFTNNGVTYLFFERYPFDTCKGIISVGEVKDQRIVNVRDILIRPYHLSYPNVIEENGEIYMIPECSANRCIEIWRATKFPDEWELYSTAFQGRNMADSVYYCDKNGNKWLFTSEASKSPDEHCYKLSLFKIDSLAMHEIKEHPCSPIVIDCSCARNGGRIFEQDGHIYRVAQNNSFGEYGHGIAIMEIIKLNDDEYQESLVKRIDHPICETMLGTHHMTESGGMYVMDICTKR